MLPLWSSDLDPLGTLSEEMTDLMNRRFLGRGMLPEWFESDSSLPRLNMIETPESLTVEAELPGVEPQDVDISIEGGELRIRGERKAPEEKGRMDYLRRERTFGPFERTIELPVKVDVDRVQAKFASGILQIVLPKSPESRSRRIEVKVG
jgi:HSP20 family protein